MATARLRDFTKVSYVCGVLYGICLLAIFISLLFGHRGKAEKSKFVDLRRLHAIHVSCTLKEIISQTEYMLTSYFFLCSASHFLFKMDLKA